MIIPSPIALSTGSATLFFIPSIGNSARETFSRGCAINLNRYITASIKPYPSNQIYLNGSPISIEPVQKVVEALAPESISIYLDSELPLSSGLGVSAASTLASCFAIARRYDLNMTRLDLGMIAHHAEVECQTGLGDVATQLCGGIVLRECINGPLHCTKINTLGEDFQYYEEDLFYEVIGQLSTSEVLKSNALMSLISQEGNKLYNWLHKNLHSVNMEQLIEKSLSFAEACGFAKDPDIHASISSICKAGGKATVAMLGKTVLATKRLDSSGWERCKVDNLGTRWL